MRETEHLNINESKSCDILNGDVREPLNIKIRSKSNLITSKTKEIIIFLLFIFTVFVSEQFFREPLFNFTVEYLKKFHQNMSKNNLIIIICEILAGIGNIPGYGVIIFFAYNFLNIYKSAFLIFILFICTFLTGFLKMIYMNPRPYFMSNDILSVSHEKGWGNPSGHSLTAVCFFLSLWRIMFQSKYLKYKENLKSYSFLSTLILIFFIMYSRVLIAAHSLNQIIFGGLLGFSVFYLFFFVLEIDTENPEQLLNFIELDRKTKFYFLCNKKIYNYMLLISINIVFLIMAVILYLINVNSEHENEFKKIMFDRFELDGYGTPESWKILQGEGFTGFTISLGNVCLFFALFLEFKITFQKNKKAWIIYNFDYPENSYENLQEKSNVYLWSYNLTLMNYCKKILLLCCLTIILFMPFYLISMTSHNICLVVIFKFIFPINICLLGIYYFFKHFYRYFNVINPLPTQIGTFAEASYPKDYERVSLNV